jgi:hypothetical protein
MIKICKLLSEAVFIIDIFFNRFVVIKYLNENLVYWFFVEVRIIIWYVIYCNH